MAIVPITNHVQQALALLAQQFHGNVQIEAIVRAIVRRVQDFEDLAIAVVNGFDLDTAIGAQLDLIGVIVGEPRQGREDEEYRLHIRARIRLNVGSGTGPDIIDIVALMLTGRSAEMRPYYPASFVVEVHGATTDDEGAEAAVITRSATAAGVGAQFIYSNNDDSTSFIWADGDTEEASTTQGWAADADDEPEGGILSEVYGAT